MKSFLLIISFVSIISCKEKSEKDQIPIEVQQETTDVTETKESHENIDGTVSLNNGELWLANPETTEGIQKMKKRMALFNNSENLKAYVILKTGLEEDFTELFEKCTMKGEAHNQLHNYLFPFLDLFDSLETSDLVVCKKSFSELNIHLNEYSNYFKS